MLLTTKRNVIESNSVVPICPLPNLIRLLGITLMGAPFNAVNLVTKAYWAYGVYTDIPMTQTTNEPIITRDIVAVMDINLLAKTQVMHQFETWPIAPSGSQYEDPLILNTMITGDKESAKAILNGDDTDHLPVVKPVDNRMYLDESDILAMNASARLLSLAGEQPVFYTIRDGVLMHAFNRSILDKCGFTEWW